MRMICKSELVFHLEWKAWRAAGPFVALLTAVLPANAREIPVRIENCPAPLALVVPDRYRLAVTVEEIATRDEAIAKLHANPKRKARYAEIVRLDWSPDVFPAQIMVASLGSLRGTYTEKEWVAIRDGLASMPEGSVRSFGKQGADRLKGEHDRAWSVAFTTTPTVSSREWEVITTMESSIKYEDVEIPMINVAKIVYAHGCIGYITFAMDRDAEGALSRAMEFIEKVSVK